MKLKSQDYDVIFTTKFATIGLLFEGEKLTNLAYLEARQNKIRKTEPFEKVKHKIAEYLAGKSTERKLDVVIKLNVTDFQRSVLEQLQKIPYGETRTYGDIAKRLKTSPRAVGNACRNNPLPIIIPCHRVVAANGIGGYDGTVDGGKLDIKHALLKLESVA